MPTPSTLTTRPVLQGTCGIVVAGHFLAPRDSKRIAVRCEKNGGLNGPMSPRGQIGFVLGDSRAARRRECALA